jgi:transposase InsO family protein
LDYLLTEVFEVGFYASMIVLEPSILAAAVMEARVLVGEYRQHYNHQRPHSAVSYLTPPEFAAPCASVADFDYKQKEVESVPALS